MKFHFKPLYLIFTAIFITSGAFVGCQGTPPRPKYLEEEKDYDSIVEKNTRRKEVYSGIYNTLTAAATLRRSEVVHAIIERKAELYQWDETTFKSELSKEMGPLASETQMFVSFYTPERKHDDLHRNQTLWKLFLDVGGHRYEGKATKIKLLTSEISAVYPAHNRFSTPYMVTFPVSTATVDSQTARFTITGPVGSLTLEFE